jgi:hypothetical protein
MPVAPAVPMVINTGRSADKAAADTSSAIHVTTTHVIAFDLVTVR